MKKLIMISSLFVYSSVTGESMKSEILYKWETVAGIQWRYIGDVDTQAKYKGDVLVGRPHGIGTMFFPDGNKYVGEFINGLFHGQGIYIVASDGSRFIGEFRVGLLWNGILKKKDGTIDFKVVDWEKMKQ